MKDVWLANDKISDLMLLMAAPLIKPDNEIYGARIYLDADEGAGRLRVKWDGDSMDSVFATPLEEISQDNFIKGSMRISQLFAQYGNSIFYAELKRTSKTTLFLNNMRIGQSIWVVGRYKANKKYKLVNRTERTMPVLDVLYIGK